MVCTCSPKPVVGRSREKEYRIAVTLRHNGVSRTSCCYRARQALEGLFGSEAQKELKANEKSSATASNEEERQKSLERTGRSSLGMPINPS